MHSYVTQIATYIHAYIIARIHFSCMFRVMVLDHGKLLEMDRPQNLVNKPDSVFAAMAKETNKTFGDNMQTGKASNGTRGTPSELEDI